jgi:hypothetical protein
MNEVLWQMSVPVTGIIRGPCFEALPKRQCGISFSIEAEDGSEKWLSLLFDGVEVYKCTYLTSLGSVPQSLRTEAYGKVIAVKNSDWLAKVNECYQIYHRGRTTKPNELRHLMICFDDGPCYELICTNFKLPTDKAGK